MNPPTATKGRSRLTTDAASRVGDSTRLDSQDMGEAQQTNAAEPGPSPAPTSPASHVLFGQQTTNHIALAGDHSADSDPYADATPTAGTSESAPFPSEWEAAAAQITFHADILDDLETIRIANSHRLKALTRTPEKGGKGLAWLPEFEALDHIIDQIAAAEHEAAKQLQKAVKRHPLADWIQNTTGIGLKQAGRLLGVLPNPYWNDLHDRPRTVSELWAYCGYHVIAQSISDIQSPHGDGGGDGGDLDQYGNGAPVAVVGVAARRTKGQRDNWSTTAKTRTYLIAESCIKNRNSPYRKIYDLTRTKYENATHTTPCHRCGPSGKPAPLGSPLSAGHQHARGMRAVSKAILKDLWREAKHAHEAPQ